MADEQEECSVRKKVLSFALSAGLMAATVSTAFAQGGASNTPDMGLGEGGRAMTRADMTKSMQDFCNYTQRNWSILGFETVGGARGSLGGDWFTDAARLLGATTANVCTVTAAPAPTTTQGGSGGTTGSGGTGAGGTGTGTTPGGTSTGTSPGGPGTGTGTGAGGGAATGGGE